MMPDKDSDPGKGSRSGLRYWMERVLDEVDSAGRDLSADRVHDLRVALRRCRSMAEGYMSIDPDEQWKALQKDGRKLFRRLGKLRDVQVLQEWIGRLGIQEDPAAVAMLLHLGRSEQELKRATASALRSFDREKWRDLIVRLQARVRSVPAGGSVFQLSALQAWNQAHMYHQRALRDRTPTAYHRLRIGIKKFRYLIENFLPLQHADWGRDLKQIQDCLGEAHDLWVFWQTASRLDAFPDSESRHRWQALLSEEKAKRIDRYREKMTGRQSLWNVWRQGLPPQNRLRSLSLRMIEKWASFHRISLVRARHVRRLALQLFNGLQSGKTADLQDKRAILHFAAILHELGFGKKGKRQSAAGLLGDLPCVPGFTAESLQWAALIIRSQRGKFLAFDGGEYAFLSQEERRVVIELSGILRLARVLALDSGQTIAALKVEHAGHSIVIGAAGYSELGPLAEKAARARYLLEWACGRPIVIRNLLQESTQNAATDSRDCTDSKIT